MKRFSVFLFLILILIATTTFAEVSVVKSTVARPKSIGRLFPQIAQNTSTGDSLVVWLESSDTNHIVGRLIDKNAKSITKQFNLFSGDWIFDLALAYNPIRNEYFLLWDDRPDGAQRVIFALRLNSAGKPVGKPVEISKAIDSESTKSWTPRVTFNPKTGGYSAVWQHSDGPVFQLVGAAISDDGKASRPVVIKEAQGDFPPHSALGCSPMDIAFHAPSGKLLVTFFRVRSDHAEDYWLATLDPLLKKAPRSASVKLSKEPVQASNGTYFDGFEGASIALHDNTGVVFFNDNTTVKRRDISLKGRPAGQPVEAFSAPLNKTLFGNPEVIFSTVNGITKGLLVAVQVDQDTGDSLVWGQPLDSKGRAVGSPTKLFTGSLGYFGNVETLAPLNTPATSTISRFVWLAPFSTPRGDGILKLKLSLSD
jgi:hypothetical protein